MRSTSECVILAADGLTLEQTLALVNRTSDRIQAVKIHSLWDRHGPGVVRQLLDAGAPNVWVDLKLKDIPETVRDRARAVAESGAQMLTVHASGEIEMMMAACESGLEIIAVTVLTSLDEDVTHLLHGQPSKAAVLYLARLAKLAGVPSVVCSPREVGLLSRRPELQGMNFITPGIRSAGVSTDDQKRVDTPASALKAGATRLVIGRQITKAQNPLAALDAIEMEINA
jgi:orotidine-5'-phosphate decarboxylase